MLLTWCVWLLVREQDWVCRIWQSVSICDTLLGPQLRLLAPNTHIKFLRFLAMYALTVYLFH